jgi:hypothetical protein
MALGTLFEEQLPLRRPPLRCLHSCPLPSLWGGGGGGAGAREPNDGTGVGGQLSFSSKLCGVLPGSLGWGWEQAPSWYSALPGPRLSRKWYLVARHGGVDLLGTRMERRCDNVRFARCWCRKLQVLRFAWSWRGEKYFLEREFPRDAADGVLLPILPFFQGALLLGGGELL